MKYTNLIGMQIKCNGLRDWYKTWGNKHKFDTFSGECNPIITEYFIWEHEGEFFGQECVRTDIEFVFPISELERTGQLKIETYELY